MTDRADFNTARSWAGVRVLVLSPTPTWPIDYGNRRRIYHLCRRLKALGAEIHFLHYPTEEQWGQSLPLDDQRRMVSDWDAYYVAPVTQRVYTPSIAADHTIDEWWDPGIAQVLDWLFRVQTFDIFIVNYVWLSKAFESAPPGIFKILDTHDRFSDRRSILEQNGLAAEFFHTTDDEERIGLDRADLVWAIKNGEEEQLRLLCDRPVVTMLHAEPVVTRWPKARSEILRFGMTGGDNNINIMNFRRFLSVASEFIRRTLLPCEIVIGGSCCDLLGDQKYSFIRQLGRLKTMDEFYEEVDVVLGPMEFSTGLKIRIGEAMSVGKAVVSHVHCFEGYIPSHRFHTLPSFEAMMDACREIVQSPAIIDDLEAASIESITRAQRSVDRALDASLPRHKAVPRGVVFVVNAVDVQDGSLILDHICEAAVFIGHQCKVLFWLDAATGAIGRRALTRLHKLGGILFSPRFAAVLGENLRGFGALRVVSLEDLMNGHQLGFWFTSVPPVLPRRLRPLPMPVFLPLSILAMAVDQSALLDFVGRIKASFSQIVAMDTSWSAVLASAAGRNVITAVVPVIWRGYIGETLTGIETVPRETVAFLVSDLSGTLFDLVCDVASQSTRRPIEIVYNDVPGPRRGRGDSGLPRKMPLPATGVTAYSRRLFRLRQLPALVVQVGDCPAFSALAEWFDRAGVPRLPLFSSDAARPILAGRSPGRVSGVMESAMRLADTLMNEDKFSDMSKWAARRYDTTDDSGWTIIWDRAREIAAREVESQAAAEVNVAHQEVRAELVLHFQQDGDRRYVTGGWAGIRGSRQFIDSFGIRPLDVIDPADIEYKGFGPNGRETPWVSDSRLCGTRDREIPLTGFAVRLAPHIRDQFDVVYQGAFFDSGPTDVKRNGESCLPVMEDDPLETMSIRLLERTSTLS